MGTTKPAWASKTIGFNVLAVVVSVALAFGFGDHEPYAEVSEIAVMVIALVNVALRYVTKEPIRRVGNGR